VPLMFDYENDDEPLIGRICGQHMIKALPQNKDVCHGAYAQPRGMSECGCSIEEEFVTHWKPIEPPQAAIEKSE